MLNKLLTKVLLIATCFWVIQFFYLHNHNSNGPERIKAQGEKERGLVELHYKQNLHEIETEFEEKKLLASGKTVFDRIYNTQDQSLDELITRIANEALPKNWTLDVKTEEFTHFILLIYLPHNAERASLAQVANYLEPVFDYCGFALTDVAIFDRTHKSYLFIDQEMMDDIKGLIHRELAQRISIATNDVVEEEPSQIQAVVERAKKQGNAFTRYNSSTIECEKQDSHLFLPMEISGSDGVVTTYALFDTGASSTMISSRGIRMTGHEDLINAPRRTFNTANGRMSCPIVFREVNIGGYRKKIGVAVNQSDELSLLGMDFFESMNYIVDYQKSVIYIWEKL